MMTWQYLSIYNLLCFRKSSLASILDLMLQPEMWVLVYIHLQVLENCIRNRTFPKHFSAIIRRHNIKAINSTSKRHALNEIDTVKSGIERLNRDRIGTSQAVEGLSDHERAQFEDYLQLTCRKQTKRMIDKLTAGMTPQNSRSNFPENPEGYVHNLSSVILSDVLLGVLSLRHKFCVPKRETRQFDLEVQFENLFCQLQDLSPSSQLNLDHFKSSLVDSCYQYLKTKSPLNSLLKKKILRPSSNWEIIVRSSLRSQTRVRV